MCYNCGNESVDTTEMTFLRYLKTINGLPD